MQSHRKKNVIVIIVLVIILGGLYSWHHIRQHIAAKALTAVSNVPTVVEMTKVKSQVWHPQIQAIGSFVAQQGIKLSTQVDGVVQAINFKSGQFVNQGVKLLQLDPSVLRATAEKSKATYQGDVLTYQRNKILYAKRAIAKSMLDDSRATMLADKGQMDEDAANLAQTVITAPFSGKLGIRKVNIGQYLAAGDVIVSLQSVDPILVDFSLSEVYLHKINVGNQVSATTSAYPGQTFSGKIIAMNAELNSNTRTLDIRAEIPNKDRSLIPGMFANINVIVATKSNVLTVPQMAVQYSPFGDTVFVVQNNKAVQRYVTLGEQRGAEIEVTRGLSAAETIVAVGAEKLQNGTAVTTKEQLAAAQQAKTERQTAKKLETTVTGSKKTGKA